jgi:D-alanine-D-alanine ligase
MSNLSNKVHLGKVAVLMGGWSAEREISLKSGQAVLSALRAQGIKAEGIDVNRQVIEPLGDSHYDRAFVALHGRGGEDGVIQGVLELLQIPYTGSGVLASALCMNKLMTKQLWRGAGLSTPNYCLLTADFDSEVVIQQLGLPLIVKPVFEGSSIGLTKVEHADQLKDAWQKAARSEGPVLAEQWIEGTEYTVAILRDEALPVIRLETPRAFYDFEAKYHAQDTRYYCPCGLPKPLEQRLRALALKAFRVTGATGWGRVDLISDQAAKPWLIEINTAPGMTDHSLVPMAAAAAGIDFKSLVRRILESSGLSK